MLFERARRHRFRKLPFFALALAMPIVQASPLVVDSAISHAEFSVRVLWFGKVVGILDKVRGRVRLLGVHRVQVDLQVDARALHMRNRNVERFASGPEFFDSAKFPNIDFRSVPFNLATIVTGGPVDGYVTLRGITHKVAFQVLPQPCANLQHLVLSGVRHAVIVSRAASTESRLASAPIDIDTHLAVHPGARDAYPNAAGLRVPDAACRVLARGYIRRRDFGMRGHQLIIADRVELGLVLWLQRSRVQALDQIKPLQHLSPRNTRIGMHRVPQEGRTKRR